MLEKEINVVLKGKNGKKMTIGFDNEEEIKQVIKFYFVGSSKNKRLYYGSDFIDLKKNIVVINDNIFKCADSIVEAAILAFIKNKNMFSDIFFILDKDKDLSGVFIKDKDVCKNFCFFDFLGRSIKDIGLTKLNFIPSNKTNGEVIIEFSKFQVKIFTKFNNENRLRDFFLKSA